jgi:PKD repeat protein
MKYTKKRTGKRFSIVFTIALLFLVAAAIIPGVRGAQQPVELGTAGDYRILAESAISDTPPSVITGDIGLSPTTGAAITGLTCPEVTGTIYTVDDTGPACGSKRVIAPVLLTRAVSDMVIAYTAASTRTPADFTDIGAGGAIGGMNLVPGLYKFTGAVTIPTDLTLTGGPDDVWIFQIPGALDITSGQHVRLSGGARAQNIFWIVGGATTLGTSSVFNGNILDATAITLGSGAKLNGRALAQAAVILNANTVNPPPKADFTFTPASGPAYLNVAFTDTSTPAVTITSREWDFGDGVNSSEQNPVYKYLVPGVYPVTLTVTDVNGGSDTKTQTVTVTPPTLAITLSNVPVSLTLNPGEITTNTDAQFNVTSTTDWEVTAMDADGTTSGYMTSYSVSGSHYTIPETKLAHPFKVLDSTSSYSALGAGSPVVLKTGAPEDSGTAYPLGVRQDVEMTDPALPGTDVYRIVVTLTVSPT